ncbi:N-acetylglucosamine kinase [Paenibacillus barcinonensis]|uniref:N-acetylglucosamine kinase n=1 Tax=Paenibacillus barcinonensis TaxID=198119 RepID=A0A2V4VU22_PAEBA|nr:BadF/BadG/BcrA/BcrD ATPase family protein [Paenibacillus barcinonensis]PYE42345.1 N-acetylglucosamine kinase-like BadF-type ATPase [Paenibacillus barcinonensis]QKS58106.1 N-acetylglucosamine kinase [Paenibacillus barcinonensis]
MRVYAGIDGGGTKTDAAIISEHGDILAVASGSATNPHSVPPQEAITELLRILDLLFSSRMDYLSHCESICLGMSGIAEDKEREWITTHVHDYMIKKKNSAGNSSTCAVWVVTEGEIALMAALGQPHGLLAISGTGSIIYGITPEGKVHRTGGWGHLLGDEGSGYRIGQRTLQAVMQSHDGMLPPTVLTSLVQHELHIRHVPDLKHLVYQPDWTKSSTASMARLTIEAASAGDKTASAILMDEARQLANTAQALIRQCVSFYTAPMALSGSIFRHSALFRDTFVQQLHDIYDSQQVVYLEDAPAPAVGAAQLARHKRHLAESS